MGSTARRNDELVIGLIGLGSIGTRHALKLKELGVTKIICLRTNAGTKKEVDAALQNILVTCTTEKEFRSHALDALIIANPTSLHAQTLVQFADLNIPMFVEKPMVSVGSELSLLTKLNQDSIFIGYCLRYHPIIQSLKKLLDEKVVGDIFLANIAAGHYLPHWHPYADYTKEYYSRKDLGGGALRTLSHEIDLMIYLFGKPTSVKSTAEKISDLTIDVDDYVNIKATYTNLRVKIDLDFIQLKSKRIGVFYGTLGEIHYDFSSGEIYTINRDNLEKKNIDYTKNQDMYLEQMRAFLNFIGTPNHKLFCNFDEAVTIASIIDQTKTINHND